MPYVGTWDLCLVISTVSKIYSQLDSSLLSIWEGEYNKKGCEIQPHGFQWPAYCLTYHLAFLQYLAAGVAYHAFIEENMIAKFPIASRIAKVGKLLSGVSQYDRIYCAFPLGVPTSQCPGTIWFHKFANMLCL